MFENSKSKINLTHYIQSHNFCGPASLKILLSHFGKDYSEEELAQLAKATRDHGTEREGMIGAIKALGGYAFAKEHGTIEELEYFVHEEGLPVIIVWFDRDADHYSVVLDVTDKNIVIADPSSEEPTRLLDRQLFPNIWFGFAGRDNKIVTWGWYMVVTFTKREFKIPIR